MRAAGGIFKGPDAAVYTRQKEKGPSRVLFHTSRLQAYLLLPPLRPGLPGTPPTSSFEFGAKGNTVLWFELPGSQASGPLPTPWLHLLCDLPPPLVALQLVTEKLVNVTAAFAKASPLKGVV